MNKETKKYRLLKELPFMPIGTVYFKNKNGENGCDGSCYLPDKIGMKHERFAIHVDYVENNPEWFEPVVEPIEQDAFVWNDELVNECLLYAEYHTTGISQIVDGHRRNTIANFKQSKSTQPEKSDTVVEDKGGIPLPNDFIETDRIGVQFANGEKMSMEELIKKFWKQPLQFYSPPKRYSQEEVDAIRKELEVTEQLLNERQRVLDAIPECPVHGRNCVPHALAWIEKMLRTEPSTQPEKEVKDWEVLEYFPSHPSDFPLIKSVRRLSDNTSLNVGQITDSGRITGFSVCGNNLMAEFENGSRMININNIKFQFSPAQSSPVK